MTHVIYPEELRSASRALRQAANCVSSHTPMPQGTPLLLAASPLAQLLASARGVGCDLQLPAMRSGLTMVSDLLPHRACGGSARPAGKFPARRILGVVWVPQHRVRYAIDQPGMLADQVFHDFITAWGGLAAGILTVDMFLWHYARHYARGFTQNRFSQHELPVLTHI